MDLFCQFFKNDISKESTEVIYSYLHELVHKFGASSKVLRPNNLSL